MSLVKLWCPAIHASRQLGWQMSLEIWMESILACNNSFLLLLASYSVQKLKPVQLQTWQAVATSQRDARNSEPPSSQTSRGTHRDRNLWIFYFSIICFVKHLQNRKTSPKMSIMISSSPAKNTILQKIHFNFSFARRKNWTALHSPPTQLPNRFKLNDVNGTSDQTW